MDTAGDPAATQTAARQTDAPARQAPPAAPTEAAPAEAAPAEAAPAEAAPLAALGGVRICDFTGQLAGAGATKILAAFGAQVIRIEDPTNDGRWDILRGTQPFVGEHRGIEAGGGFNNHNPNKLGITLNLRTPEARDVLRRLVAASDAVTENFAAGVLDRLGFGYDALRQIKPDIVYVANTGFGATGPYASFKSWGPIVQAVSGLTHQSGLPDLPPAGWGYSFMDHGGAYFMAIATLMALLHRRRTGEGQRVDLSCIEAAGGLHGPATLDYTVNGRPARRPGAPHSNRSTSPLMAPHGVFRCADDSAVDGAARDRADDSAGDSAARDGVGDGAGADRWVAIAVRNDDDWAALGSVVDEPWARTARWATLGGRVADEDELERRLAEWTARHERDDVARRLVEAGVPAAPVLRPSERIDGDARTADCWLEVPHTQLGPTKLEGLPVRLGATDWQLTHAAPCLGEHNDYVLRDVLGYSASEVDTLRERGAI